MVFYDRPHVRAVVGKVRHEGVAVITGFIQIVRHHVRDLPVPALSMAFAAINVLAYVAVYRVPCPVWCHAGRDARFRRVCTPTPGSDEAKAPCRDTGQCQRGEGRTAADEPHGRTLRGPEPVVSARLQQPRFGHGIWATNSYLLGPL